jgi:ankyrin repeat protein
MEWSLAAESEDEIIRLHLNLREEPVRLLLDGGAKESVNVTDKNSKTSLHPAAANRDRETVRSLLNEKIIMTRLYFILPLKIKIEESFDYFLIKE